MSKTSRNFSGVFSLVLAALPIAALIISAASATMTA